MFFFHLILVKTSIKVNLFDVLVFRNWNELMQKICQTNKSFSRN